MPTPTPTRRRRRELVALLRVPTTTLERGARPASELQPACLEVEQP